MNNEERKRKIMKKRSLKTIKKRSVHKSFTKKIKTKEKEVSQKGRTA